MKSTTFTVLATATLVAAQPRFLNSAFDVVPGQPFELTFEGCENGCTISLENGTEDDLQLVETLTSSATGGSFTVTLDEDIATDEYAFRITDNSNGEENFSILFPVEGSAPPASSSPATSAPATTSAPVTSSASETESATSETESETESVTTVTSASTVTSVSSAATTPASSTTRRATSTEEETSTGTSEPTEIPENGAAGVQAQLGLILAAAAAVAYL